MAGTYDMRADQGATFSDTITWQEPAGGPVDLSGGTARMQVRRSAQSDKVALELTTDDTLVTPHGTIVLGGVAGTITLTAPAEVMADVDAGWYRYDLFVVIGTVVTKLLEGSFTVTAQVTR